MGHALACPLCSLLLDCSRSKTPNTKIRVRWYHSEELRRKDGTHEPECDGNLAAYPGRSDEWQLHPTHEVHQKVGVGEYLAGVDHLRALHLPHRARVAHRAVSWPGLLRCGLGTDCHRRRLRRRVGSFAGVL